MKFYANLKCNHTRVSFEEYLKTLTNKIMPNKDIVLFPPFSAFCDTKFHLGAQNFYPVKNGSFTGEIGLDMLREFGVDTVLIGHSERRNLGESEEFLRAKFEFAKSENLEIVYWIGENLNIYENAKTKEFLKAQLTNIDLNYEKLIIAYEPIWAIGTGKSADIEYITQILSFLKTFTNAPLFYGGSVNLDNITQILKVTNLSGVLVGTASFDARNFINLVRSGDDIRG
ncbi:MAG: triose-phosphate isomerase [Campylobacter sp.]|nr:triose-phosphate isomerase [Campylobacter sp.]